MSFDIVCSPAFIGSPLKVKLSSRNYLRHTSSSKTLLSKINLTSGIRFFQGRDPFILVFEDSLPLDVGSTWADFGKEAVVYLERRNDHNLIGIIPG